MKRYVYAFDTSTAAMSAVEYLGANGIDGQHVSLVARSDINKNELPDSLVNVSMDFTPSVKRGAALRRRDRVSSSASSFPSFPRWEFRSVRLN